MHQLTLHHPPTVLFRGARHHVLGQGFRTHAFAACGQRRHRVVGAQTTQAVPEISKIEKSVSIDHTRNCIQT